MKNIICFFTLFCIILAISPMMGCGRSGDESQKNIAEPEATQAVVEQKAEETTEEENNVLISQTKEPAEGTEVQPADQVITDIIIIENQGYTTDKKGSVEFSHLKHSEEYGISCIQCHHLYEDGVNLWKKGDHVDKCVVCHDPAEEKDNVMKLQSAFHQNCRDCHKAMSEEGKEAPYKRCSDCHG